jgi:hypothetical protein
MTIRCTLHDNGIFSRIAVKKPFLADQHMSRRLDFARQYCGWCAAEWERVCWMDESTFEIGKKILNKFIFGERHMSDIHQVV